MSPVYLLPLEDDEGEIIITPQVLKEAKVTSTLSSYPNGENANDLNKQGPAMQSEIPGHELAGIKLSRPDGKEVLSYIKKDPSMNSVPVVIHTGCNKRRCVFEPFKNHVNYYISKSKGTDKVFQTIQKIENFGIPGALLRKTPDNVS